MKRQTLLFLLFLLTFSLTACGNEEEPFEHDVPREYGVNIQELAYSSYLSLNNPVVTITVQDIGEIRLQLFPDLAPNTVNNFIQYIEDGAYDNNSFHRVVENFMIQGGELEEPVCNIPGEMSENDFENDLVHYRGVISMARVGDNYNSANSQFFILHVSTSQLDGLYAPFGAAISGFNVIDYIASLQSESGEFPITEIIISSITVDLNGYTPEDRICYTGE
jgi:peptidyl-prolyl cis-trans isomerase B (cyclophilin B)